MSGGLARSGRSTVLHVDMDAFFASVAIRDRPELAGLPVIVGGSHRGVVLSATYEARRFGVRSAMPMTRARRLCPRAVVLRTAPGEVEATSRAVMEIFRQVTPVVRALSVDEAFLEVAGSLRRLGSPLEVAEHVRARVHDEQRITCSVGIAPNPSVAKMASRRAKPDGVVQVLPEQVTSFLHPLDVGELWGVGDKTRARLHRLGLVTIGDLARTPPAALRHALGPHAGAHLHALAWGRDTRTLTPRAGMHEPERSIGAEETFGHDTDDPRLVRRELLRLSAKVGHRVRASGFSARTVALKIRFADFTTLTRSRTLTEHTDVTSTIYATAADLFAALGQRSRVRLVGVRLEGLRPREQVHHQLVLGAPEHGWSDADRAVDAAVHRFGGHAVHPASLLGGGRP